MGTIDLGALARAAEESSEATEIGSMPMTREVTAMWVGPASPEDHTLVYRREVGPVLVRAVPRSISNGRERHHWWRGEVQLHLDTWRQLEGVALFTEATNDERLDCALAIQPYSVGWTAQSPFKRSLHAKRDDAPAQCASPDALLEFVRQFGYDYWETANYVTAGFDTWPAPALRNPTRNAALVLGMCQNFRACWATLFETDSVQRLLDATERDTIYYQAQGVPRVPLDHRVREACREHMAVAIRQALAGPDSDSDDWLGRTVEERAGQIYRGHLNNHNRRLALEPDFVPFDDGRDWSRA